MNGMDSPMREALRRQESACAHDVPAFASIAARIEAAPSPLEAERWPAAKGARLRRASWQRRCASFRTPCLRLRWWWLRLRWPVRA